MHIYTKFTAKYPHEIIRPQKRHVNSLLAARGSAPDPVGSSDHSPMSQAVRMGRRPKKGKIQGQRGRNGKE